MSQCPNQPPLDKLAAAVEKLSESIAVRNAQYDRVQRWRLVQAGLFGLRHHFGQDARPSVAPPGMPGDQQQGWYGVDIGVVQYAHGLGTRAANGDGVFVLGVTVSNTSGGVGGVRDGSAMEIV